jgi:hypothetical protein
VFSTDLKVAAVAHVMDIEDGPCLAGGGGGGGFIRIQRMFSKVSTLVQALYKSTPESTF